MLRFLSAAFIASVFICPAMAQQDVKPPSQVPEKPKVSSNAVKPISATAQKDPRTYLKLRAVKDGTPLKSPLMGDLIYIAKLTKKKPKPADLGRFVSVIQRKSGKAYPKLDGDVYDLNIATLYVPANSLMASRRLFENRKTVIRFNQDALDALKSNLKSHSASMKEVLVIYEKNKEPAVGTPIILSLDIAPGFAYPSVSSKRFVTYIPPQQYNQLQQIPMVARYP